MGKMELVDIIYRLNALRSLVRKSLVFVVFCVSVSVSALTTNVTHTGVACAGGVLALNNVLSATSPKIPAGHAKPGDGYWSSTNSALSFSNPNDINAILDLSNVTTAGSVTVQWNHNSGHVYNINIPVSVLTLPAASLTYNGSTADVLLCSEVNLNLVGSPAGYSNYTFYVSNGTTQANTIIDAKTSETYTLKQTEYAALDEVFYVATASNGCQDASNSLLISTVTDVQVQVVGSASVCTGATLPNEKLEVIPYLPSADFIYQWDIPGADPSPNTTGTVTTSAFGNYSVTVSSTKCLNGPWKSNVVTVQSYSLPTVSVIPAGPLSICGVGGSVELTAQLSALPFNSIDFRWDKNNVLVFDDGSGIITSSKYLVSSVGTYRAVISETGNEECWTASNEVVVNTKEIALSISAINNTSFCEGVNYNPQLSVTVTGGTAPYQVVVNGQTFSLAEGTSTISMAAINNTTTYQIISVKDATGCNADLITIPPATITYTAIDQPSVQNVTSVGGCVGSSLVISLSATEANVVYELRTTAGATIATVTPGVSLGYSFAAFTPTAATSYYVVAKSATSSCPEVTMNGSVNVAVLPVDQTFSAGPVCEGGTLTLSNSETGVRYYLLKDGVATGSYQDGTTGSAINFGGLLAGVYTVSAVRGACSRLLSSSLEVVDIPEVYTLSANVLSYCANVPSSGVNFTLSDSQSGVNYQLQQDAGFGYVNYGGAVPGDGNALTNRWTNLPLGKYRIVATTTLAGCSSIMSGELVVTQLALPTAAVTSSSPNRICAGESTAFYVNVTLTGKQPFSFDIVDNSGNVNSVSNYYSNTYSLHVTPSTDAIYTLQNLRDANSCGIVTGTGQASFYIDPLPVITFSSLPNPISNNQTEVCMGSAVTLTANVTNTSGLKAYSWSDGLGSNSSVTFSPNITRSYTVTVTNEYGCKHTSPVSVIVNPLPIVGFTFSDADAEVCLDDSDVALTPTGINTGGSFTSTTTNAVAGNFFYPLKAGVGRHSVTYSFASTAGCVNKMTQTIDVNPLPVVQIRNLNDYYCADAGVVTINGTPQNNNGVWSIVGSSSALGNWFVDGGDGTATLDVGAALTSGGERSYDIVYTYTDPVTGCDNQISKTTTLVDDIGDDIDFRTLPSGMCQTNSPVTLQAYFVNVTPNTVINGGAYSASGQGLIDNGDGTAKFDPSVAGNGVHTITYSYQDPVSGCSGSVSHSVQIGTTLTFHGLDSIYCKTDVVVNVYGDPGPGTLTIYKDVLLPANLLTTVYNNTATNYYPFDPRVVDAGTYIFEYTYTDATGCVNIIQQDVEVVGVLDASFDVGTSPITQFCETVSTVKLIPNSPGGVFSGDGVSLFNFSPKIAGVGVHNIRYTINTGTCSAYTEMPVTVNQLDKIWVDNLADSYCDNESGPFKIEPNISSAPPFPSVGKFTFSTTYNAAGKSPLYYVDKTKIPSDTVEIKSGYVYDGSSVLFDPTNVGEGDYFVTLTYDNSANNGCVSVVTKKVHVNQTVAVGIGGVSDPIEYCQDHGDVELWGSFEATGNFTGSGNFTGAGIDNKTADDGLAVFNPKNLTPGIYPVTYSLTLPLAQGGCSTSRTKNFKVLETPVVYKVTPSGEKHYCEGGTGITIGVENTQSGVQYQLICNNDFVNIRQTISGTGSGLNFTVVTEEGVYTVQAVSSDGCRMMMDGSVDVRKNKVAASVVTKDVSCNGGTDGIITISASGGSEPYNYKLTDATTKTLMSAANVFGGMMKGNYSIQVEDAIGCVLNSAVLVTINEPKAALEIKNVSTEKSGCVTSEDGVCKFDITGGTPFDVSVHKEGYIIVWKDSSGKIVVVTHEVNGIKYTVKGLAVGEYVVYVEDAQGCIVTVNVSIEALTPPLMLSETLASHVNNGCHGNASGVIKVQVTGGSGAANYEFSKDNVIWYPSVASDYTFVGLPASHYKIYVRDGLHLDCITFIESDVTEPDPLVLSEIPSSHKDVSCFGGTNGQFELKATGGSGSFEYFIDGSNNWQPSGVFKSLKAGYYNVWVRDLVIPSCMVQGTAIQIQQPTQLGVITDSQVNVSCNGGNDGIVKAIVTGGSAPYAYSWRDSKGNVVSTSNEAVGLFAGTYTLEVEDDEKCTSSRSVVITEPSLLTVVLLNSIPCSCPVGKDGAASVQLTGGTPYVDINYPEGYAIEWRDALNNIVGTSSSISGLINGDYTVVVKDKNGCSASLTVTIGALSALTLNEKAVKQVLCNGASTGEIEVEAGGGILGVIGGNYEFSYDDINWHSNSPASNGLYKFTSLPAGTYQIKVRNKDYPSCQQSITSYVTEPSLLDFSEILSSHQDVSCFNGTNGQFELTATGGSGSFEYFIDGSNNWQPSGMFKSLKAGYYNVWVRDLSVPSCMVQGPAIEIKQPTQLGLIKDSQTNVSCNGGNDGKIVMIAIGGTPQYEYSNDGGSTWQLGSTFSSLKAKSLPYEMKVKDSKGCESAVVDVTITEPLLFSIKEGVHQDVLCNGASTGSFTVVPTPAVGTYEYSKDGGVTWQSSSTFSGLKGGGYQVSVRDMNTTASDHCAQLNVLDVSIIEPASISIALKSLKDVSCHGGNDGEAEVLVSRVPLLNGGDPFSYQWYEKTSGGWLPLSATDHKGNTEKAEKLTVGTYKVLVTDKNSCPQWSVEYSIKEPVDLPVVGVKTITHVSVAGGNNGVIELNAITGGTAPYLLKWTGAKKDGSAILGLVDDNVRQENLVAGTYKVVVIDANGCVVILDNLVVSEPGMLAFSITQSNPQPCNGAKNGTINVSVSGGVMPYQLIVLSSTSVTYLAKTTGSNFANYEGLLAGTYTATVTDFNGNVYSEAVILSEPDALVMDFAKTKDVACYGEANGEVWFKVIGGTPYKGDNDPTKPSTPDKDYYEVIITPSVGAVRTILAEQGVVVYVSDLAADGQYMITVLDSKGCVDSESFKIFEPLPVSVIYTKKDVTCHAKGEIVAEVVGRTGFGYTYNWFKVDGNGNRVDYKLNGTSSISGLEAATYRLETIALTDGCDPDTVDVVIAGFTPLSMIATVTNVTSCAGDATGEIHVDVIGGEAPYLLEYAGKTMSGNGPFDIDNLTAGSYTLSLLDKNSCSFVVTPVLVNQPFVMNVMNIQHSIVCETINSGVLSFDVSGGALSSDGSGGTESRYLVNLLGDGGSSLSEVKESPNGDKLSVSYSKLPSGKYKLSIRDLNSTSTDGCLFEYDFELSNIIITPTLHDAMCKGINTGSIGLQIKGGSGNYTWQWSMKEDASFTQTTKDISALAAGTYLLKMTDIDRGCDLNRTYSIVYEKSLAIDAVKNDVSCKGGNNGSVIVNGVTGAVPVVKYYWNGSTVPGDVKQLNLSAGSVQLQVVDGNGCAVSEVYAITEPIVVSFDLSTSVDCSGVYSRSIRMANLKGGIGDISEFTYSYSGPGVAKSKVSSLVAMGTTTPKVLLDGLTVGGIYEITVFDRNMCSTTKSITIPGEMVINPVVEQIKCNGFDNGAIALNVTGGSGSYTYSWSKDGLTSVYATSPDISNLSAGTYIATVKDNVQNGCDKTVTATIVDPQPILIDAAITHVKCAGDNNGKIIPTVVGGRGIYTYVWSSANGSGLLQGKKDQENLTAGTYSVTVSDGASPDGCSATKSFVVDEKSPLAFDLVLTERYCDGTGTIEIINISGGYGNYQYVWSGPGIIDSKTNVLSRSNLISGIYSVTLSDYQNAEEMCNLKKEVVIEPAIKVDYVTTPVNCNNTPNGAIDITVIGGVGELTYLWSTVDGGNIQQGVADQVGLAAGTYSLTVTDTKGLISTTGGNCSLTITDIVVGHQPQLKVVGVVTPVYCNGESTGSIKVTVSGGSGNYAYNWTGAGVTSGVKDQNNIGKGQYTLTVVDNVSKCEETVVFDLAGPLDPLVVTVVSVKDVNCKGEYTGGIVVSASGGSPAYDYLWNGPGSFVEGAVQSGLPAGSYWVVVKDANGCQVTSDEIIIKEPDVKLAVSLVKITDVSVYGASTGAIQVQVVGGSGAYSLSWTGSVAILPNTYNPTGLPAGVYEVTATDENGCTSTLGGLVIRQPGEAFKLEVGKTDVRPCYDDKSGSINAYITGGDSPYTLRVLKGDETLIKEISGNGITADGLIPGNYIVEAVDGNNIKIRKDEIISQPTELIINTTITDVACYGAATGAIKVRVGGGLPKNNVDYKVVVSGNGFYNENESVLNGADYDYTALSSGDYSIRLIDDSNGDKSFDVNNDCWTETKVTIKQPEAKVLLSVDQSVCAGEEASLTFVTSQWDVVANPLLVKLSNETEVPVNTSPYTYKYKPTIGEVITIKDVSLGGCKKGTGSGSATVVVNERPSAKLYGDAEICNGESSQLSFYLTGIAPWTVVYFDGVNHFTKTNVTSSPLIVDVTPTKTTSYTLVSVADHYCSHINGTDKVTIVVDDLPKATMSGNNTICEGKTTDLTFTLTGKSPWQVTYSEAGVVKTIPNVGNSSSSPYVLKLPVSPVVTTAYELISVMDNNGCEKASTGSVLVSVDPLPDDPGEITGKLSVCQGQENVVYSISAVTNNPLNYYEWTVPAGFTIESGAGSTSVTINVAKDAVNGVIRVKVVNPCGKSAGTSEKYITVNPLPNKPGVISGEVSLCQDAVGVTYSISAVDYSSSYRWVVPAGLIIKQGNGTTAIELDVDPEQSSISGDILVYGVNDCGEGIASDPFTVTIHPLPSVNAGLDDKVCGTEYTLAATDPGAGFVGRWRLVSGSGSATIVSPTAFNSKVTNLAKGENVFEWTVTNSATGCVQSDRVVIMNNQVVVSVLADDYAVCDASTTIYGSTIPSGATGLWTSKPEGVVFGNSATSQTIVSGLHPGVNTLRWTIVKDECVNYAEMEIVNNEPSDANVLTYTIPGQSAVKYNNLAINICGESIVLKAQAPVLGVGKWTLIKGSGVISNPLLSDITISGLAKGDNVFRWTVALNGCEKSVNVTIRNNQLVVDAGEDKDLCEDKTTIVGNIPPTASISGYWYVALDANSQSLGRATFANGNNYSTQVSNLGADANYLVWSLNQSGCISTDTVVVTNNKPTTATVGSSISICGDEAVLTGNTPLQGFGYWTVHSGSGTFDDKFDPKTTVRDIDNGENVFRWIITKNGCNSSVDLNVNNLQVDVFAGKDTVICENSIQLNADSPILGTGEWSISEGTGTIISKNNPKSMASLRPGNNTLVWSVKNVNCYSRDEVIVVNNSVVANAGNDQYVVDGTAWMGADPLEVGESGYWTVLSGGGDFVDLTKTNSYVSKLQRGENSYKWTLTKGGCMDDDIVIISNGQAVIADAGLDQTICDVTAELHANDPDGGVGYWSIAPGAGNGSGTFSSINNPKTTVTGLSKGRNVFRWTIAYSTSLTYDDVVVLNNLPSNVNAGDDQTLCSDSYQLNGSLVEVGTIEWIVMSGSGVFTNSAINNPVVSGLAKGDNVLRMKVTNGQCSNEAIVTITNDLPDIPTAGNDRTLCIDSVLLTPNTPLYGVGEWQSEGASTALITGNWAKNLSPGANTFSWVIRTSNCELRDQVVITNNKPTASSAGYSVPVCENRVVLSGNTPSAREIGTWSTIVSGGTIVDVNNPKTEVTDLSLGANRFRWTIDNNGCLSTSDVAISYDYIQSIAGDTQTLCVDTAILNANNPYPGVGTWSIQAGSSSVDIDNFNMPNTTVRNLDQGENVLIWTVKNGACISTSEVVIVNNVPTEAYAGNDFPSCVNSVSLSANLPLVGVGRWQLLSGGGEFEDAISSKTRINNLGGGANLLRWTIENNGCYSFDDVEVSYNKIEAKVGNDILDNCSFSARLEANSALPGVGTWSVVGSASRASFDDMNDPNTQVNNLGYGNNTLRWTILNEGCESYAELLVVNNSPSPSYAGNNNEVCNDAYLLDATTPDYGVGTWEVLTGGANISDLSNPKSPVSGLSRGDNVFRWNVRKGNCVLSDEVLVVNNRPSLPYAGEDMEICKPAQQLKGDAPLFGTGLWSIPSGSADIVGVTDAVTVANNIGYGKNVFRWTVTQGQCSLYDEVVFTNNTATTALAGPDVQDCKDYITMDANTPLHGSGVWSLVTGNGVITSVSDPKTDIKGLNFGENIFLWTITNGSCFSTDQVAIFNRIPDKSNAGSDRTICDDYLTLNGNDPQSGLGSWKVISGAGTFEDVHKFNTVVSNVGFGENMYQWIINYGSCSTEDVMNVVNNKAKPDAGEDAVVYKPSYALKAGNPGESVSAKWSLVAGGGEFADPLFFNTTVSSLKEGVNTYRWTIQVGNCVATDDVSITYKIVPEAGFITDVSSGCYPLTVEFTNYTVGGNSFLWDFGDGNISVSRNPIHTFNETGDFLVTLTVPGPDGKDGIYQTLISVYDHPEASFTISPELVYIPGDKLRGYNTSTGASSYLWSFGDGNTSTLIHPEYEYVIEGVFDVSLIATNEKGCTDTMVVSQAVTAMRQGFIAFPNAFKPRPDESSSLGGQNAVDAVFVPKHYDVDQFVMQIFDRWGQLIFESHDVSVGWDGTYKNRMAPQDVYVYKSWGRFISGKEFQKVGSVMLVR